MMTIETTIFPTAPAPIPAWSLLARFRDWSARTEQRRAIERCCRTLLDADERLLRDIGVTRYDVRRLLEGETKG